MPKCANKSIPFRFSDKKFVHIFHFSHALNTSLFDNLPKNVGETYKLWKPSLCNFLEACHFANTLSLCPLIVNETKLHTHIKLQAKL
jgi:hypothetical protein